MKKLLILVVLSISLFSFAGCSSVIEKENPRNEDDMVGYLKWESEKKSMAIQIPNGAVLEYYKNSFVNIYLNEEKGYPYIQVSYHNYKGADEFITTYKESLAKSYDSNNLSNISEDSEERGGFKFKTLSYSYISEDNLVYEKIYVTARDEKVYAFKIRSLNKNDLTETSQADDKEASYSNNINELYDYVLRNFEIIKKEEPKKSK